MDLPFFGASDHVLLKQKQNKTITDKTSAWQNNFVIDRRCSVFPLFPIQVSLSEISYVRYCESCVQSSLHPHPHPKHSWLCCPVSGFLPSSPVPTFYLPSWYHGGNVMHTRQPKARWAQRISVRVLCARTVCCVLRSMISMLSTLLLTRTRSEVLKKLFA